MAPAPAPVSRFRIAAAFAAVYVIWGSTYLAIRYAIQTMPPLLMASVRFLLAGSVLYGWALRQGAGSRRRADWRRAFILGALLLFGGNGGVVIAEQWVPSGLTALLIATVPLWVAVLGWLQPGGRRPSFQVGAGIIIGLAGVALLIGIGNLRGAGTVDPAGAMILILASLSWAAGTLYGKKAHLSESPIQASGMQMISGGALLLIASLIRNETAHFDPGGISAASLAAVIYLVIFGAIIAFTAYSWLLKHTTPSRVATYAYVNPAIAVLLGWTVAGEPLTARIVTAMCIIVAAVMVITLAPADRRSTGSSG
jgi:drug/metabolite transporter (DMT)-like permease